MGADLAAFADAAGAVHEGERPHYRVAADGAIRPDPSESGVDKGDALRHEGLIDAIARDGGEFSELRAAVDAEAVSIVVAAEGSHALPGLAQDGEHVGQIVLALGVVVLISLMWAASRAPSKA